MYRDCTVIVRWTFSLFVLKRYCFPARSVPDCSSLQPFTVPDRLNERSWTIPERFQSFWERFRPFETSLWTETVMKRLETVRKVGRPGTVRDVGRSETYAKSRSRFKNERITVTIDFLNCVFFKVKRLKSFLDRIVFCHLCLHPFNNFSTVGRWS